MVTQKCRKVPERYTKKTPEDVCREVPDVECHLELEKVEEPNCYNTPVEECNDEYKEVPFLVDDEECEDVPRLVAPFHLLALISLDVFLHTQLRVPFSSIVLLFAL